MKHIPHPGTLLIAIVVTALASACGSSNPTGVKTDDVRGTWSGTFAEFSLMGRTLTGDADWTFTRDTFEIIFFNPPEGQAERISGDWKFADGKIALTLKSSFPIDTDVGATDTLFVSILRDEMSLKTIAESSILLVKTRLARHDNLPPHRRHPLAVAEVLLPPPVSPYRPGSDRADIRIQPDPQHTPA